MATPHSHRYNLFCTNFAGLKGGSAFLLENRIPKTNHLARTFPVANISDPGLKWLIHRGRSSGLSSHGMMIMPVSIASLESATAAPMSGAHKHSPNFWPT
jgi:hypothetical protein